MKWSNIQECVNAGATLHFPELAFDFVATVAERRVKAENSISGSLRKLGHLKRHGSGKVARYHDCCT